MSGASEKLGANGIQIMPVGEFAGVRSWGYNPSHIFSVELNYGGPVAFKQFVKRAHREGIAGILDVVYNHLGPSDLDLWQFDGWSENQRGGIYFYNDDRANTPWGETRPDYGRSEVRQFLLDNVMMWLEEYHIDGIRFDCTQFIRTVHGSDAQDLPAGWSLLQWINDRIAQQFPGRITIAEDGGFSRDLCGQYTQVYHLHDERKLIAFHRCYKGGPADDVVVVANFFHQAQNGYVIGFPAAGTWKLHFNSDWQGYNDDFKNHPSTDVVAESGTYDRLPWHAAVSIGPYSVLIFSQ